MRFCFACAVLAFCLYGTASTAAPLYFAMVCLRPSNPSPSPVPDPSPGPSPGPGPNKVFLGLSIGGMAAISSLAAQVVIWGRYRGDVGEIGRTVHCGRQRPEWSTSMHTLPSPLPLPHCTFGWKMRVAKRTCSVRVRRRG